jgi:hypothetical protein
MSSPEGEIQPRTDFTILHGTAEHPFELVESVDTIVGAMRFNVNVTTFALYEMWRLGRDAQVIEVARTLGQREITYFLQLTLIPTLTGMVLQGMTRPTAKKFVRELFELQHRAAHGLNLKAPISLAARATISDGVEIVIAAVEHRIRHPYP